MGKIVSPPAGLFKPFVGGQNGALHFSLSAAFAETSSSSFFSGNVEYFYDYIGAGGLVIGTDAVLNAYSDGGYDLRLMDQSALTLGGTSPIINFEGTDGLIRYDDGAGTYGRYYPYSSADLASVLEASSKFYLKVNGVNVFKYASGSIDFIGNTSIDGTLVGNSTAAFSGIGTFGGIVANGIGSPGSFNNDSMYTCYGSSADQTLVNLTSTSGSFATDAVSPAVKFSYNATGIGFYGTSPIAKPGATTDLGTVLSNLGLRTAGTAYPITTSGTVTFQGTTNLRNTTLTDATNVTFGTVTGTKIGTSTSEKIGFFNATPIVQPAKTVKLDDVLVNLGLRASAGVSDFSTTVTPRAGTTGAGTAPIKLTSGTNMTTAETGAMEYDGTNLFFTRTGTTRESVLCGNSGASAPATNTIGTIADYFGTSATRVLTTPNSWIGVNIGGTSYKIPAYT